MTLEEKTLQLCWFNHLKKKIKGTTKDLKKTKCQVEWKPPEQRLQLTKNQKMQLKVSMKALNTQFVGHLAAKEKAAMETKVKMGKQLMDIEA